MWYNKELKMPSIARLLPKRKRRRTRKQRKHNKCQLRPKLWLQLVVQVHQNRTPRPNLPKKGSSIGQEAQRWKFED